MQAQPTSSGSIVAPSPTPSSTFGPAAPGTMPVAGTGPAGAGGANGMGPAGSAPNGTPLTAAPVPSPFKPKHSRVEIAKTIAIVLLSILTVVFIGLFVWKFIEWNNVKTDVDGQIDVAVAQAVFDNTTKLENEFVEREKYPYKAFAGPADYGSLGFEYPKTWNLYIAKDAASGGDFEAYLNPGEVLPVGTQTINALRVVIRDNAFDNEVKRFDSYVKNGRTALSTRNVGGTLANIYTGELMNGIQGILAVFKLRDKTVLIQTDAMLFSDEYYKLLDTVNFIE